MTEGELCCPITYKCARKITHDSLQDDPHKMTTLEGKHTITNAHMHVHMPTQEPTHTRAGTRAQTHICLDISLNNVTVSSCDKVKKQRIRYVLYR